MPTLVFLTIAYQLQSSRWRSAFLILAVVNAIFNIVTYSWLQDFYSATIVTLLFMLNPHFMNWWQSRNSRNNPASFLMFAKETFMIAKHNKAGLFFWISFLIASIAAVCFYTGYTGHVLLSWLLLVFIILYVLKQLINTMLPPEWFLHDINTGYVFLSVFIAICTANLLIYEVADNFIMPMIFAVIFCLAEFHFIHRKTRFLAPGCAIILADLAWQIARVMQDNAAYAPQTLVTVVVIMAAIVINLIWLLRKPGILPIFCLTLFQLFRLLGFTNEALDRYISTNISSTDVAYYILYLVSWMYITPLLFLFTGLDQRGYLEREKDDHNERSLKKLMSMKLRKK